MSSEALNTTVDLGEKRGAFYVLEENKLLSESKIWTLLEQYYETASIAAWNEIPFYPTSNPFIAETYAELILAFLRDYLPRLDLSKPVFIVEMAAGSGCFSFYLMKELCRLMEYFSALKQIDLRYVMADFTVNNVQSWMVSEKLRPFAERGLLHFGVFRPETDRAIKKCSLKAVEAEGSDSVELSVSTDEILLEKGTTSNPVIAIANYFFDSIKQDAFQIHDGKLKEVRQTFHYVPNPADPESLKFDDLIKAESCRDASYDYYSDPRLNTVLKSYQAEYQNASILFPLGAFSCISNLLEISDNSLVLISSDKGFADAAYIEGLREQPFLPHHGVFSYSVNYDAIDRYFSALGGKTMVTSDDNLSIATAMSICVRDQADANLEQTVHVFGERVDRHNNCNYLYFLQDLLTELEPTKSEKPTEILRACMGYIQLCNYDPVVFCLAAPRVYMSLEGINVLQEQRLLEIIERVRDNFYSVQQQYDVFYWIGRILYGLNRIDGALSAFSDSLLTFGASSSSTYYIAACYEVKKEFENAFRYYEDTLKLEPSCSYTQDGLKRVKAALGKP